MSRQLESCPDCKYTLIEKTTYCPYCGCQLRQPTWKKTAAWFILILIAWGLVKCHLRMLQGLDGFFGDKKEAGKTEEGKGDTGDIRLGKSGVLLRNLLPEACCLRPVAW